MSHLRGDAEKSAQISPVSSIKARIMRVGDAGTQPETGGFSLLDV